MEPAVTNEKTFAPPQAGKKSKLFGREGEFFNSSRLLEESVLTRRAVRDETIDLIVTSPPYNVGLAYDEKTNDSATYGEYLDFSRRWMENCLHWTRPGGRFCLNIPLDKNREGKQSVGADLTRIAKEIGWGYHATIIWNEGNISRRTAWGSWCSATAPHVIAPVELILVLHKGEWKRNGKGRQSDIKKTEFMDWTCGVWTFNGESKKRIGHPAPFPRELPRRCIKLFSFVEDIVFDPFAGSGTTLIEAINNHRHAYGLEIESKYRDLALDRINRECF